MKKISQSKDCSLDGIDITSELTRRPTRPPAYEAEIRALVELADVMAAAPHTISQGLADITLELCQAGSSGIRGLRGVSLGFWIV